MLDSLGPGPLWLQRDVEQDIISRSLYEEKLLKVRLLDDPTTSEISETTLPKENYQLLWHFLESSFFFLSFSQIGDKCGRSGKPMNFY